MTLFDPEPTAPASGCPRHPGCSHAYAFHTDAEGTIGPCAYPGCGCGVETGAQAGMRLRDEGMARADEAADEEWKALAKSAVLWCARQLRPFTSDDVWARMLAVDEERARAREPRALGAVISKAYRDKFIEPTGEYRPSDRPETHRNPKRVWITATP